MQCAVAVLGRHCRGVQHSVHADKSWPDFVVLHTDSAPVLGGSNCSTASQQHHCIHWAAPSAAGNTVQKAWFHSLFAMAADHKTALLNTLAEKKEHKKHHLVGKAVPPPKVTVAGVSRKIDA
jgi:hypothetical protein